jgi:hypothetical protein
VPVVCDREAIAAAPDDILTSGLFGSMKVIDRLVVDNLIIGSLIDECVLFGGLLHWKCLENEQPML